MAQARVGALTQAETDAAQPGRRVSIIIPCRNEARTIGICLDSIIANDYPKELLQVLVVDGMSDDETRQVLNRYVQRFSYIRVLENPSRTIPAALNIGIRSSRGEYVVRMDAHSSFGTDTLSKYVEYLRKSGADGVGGRIATVPCEKTMVGKGIALAMSEPFGVGNSRFRVTRDSAAQSEWTPVVVFPCLRREVFDRVGLFDENILRSEDMAMFQRMQRHGCRFLFVPSIVNCYYSRSDLKSFCKHAFDNGLWAILPTKYTGRVVVSLRHLIPLAFVAGVLILGVLSVFQSFFLLVLLLVIGTYLLASLGFSIAIARREGDIRYVAIMPMLFGMLHFGYGAGSLLGVAQVIPALRSMPSTRHSQTSG